MKRLIILIFLMFSLRTFAPASNCLVILDNSPIQPYEKLWEAICEIESGGNPYAIGDKHLMHHSYGIVQIRQSRLNDYVKQTGKVYTVQDCFDKEVSREIFMFYVSPDFETTAREWNGGANGMKKKSTLKYWEKVENKLKEL